MANKRHSRLHAVKMMNMVLLKTARDLNKFLDNARADSKTLGFVPTMGALHTGHISLVEASRLSNAVTISSIFINPTQFNDPKDFEKYPVTLDKDIEALEHAGCDFLFLPSIKEIYPEGTHQVKHFDLGFIETILEGKYRPGHFQGVCQVMEQLINVVKPDNIYMGQKDYQQCLVVDRLLKIMGSKAVMHPCPTLREPDGLAMSSRNLRLNAEERKKAAAIYAVLTYLKENLHPGKVEHLKAEAIVMLETKGFNIDYVEIADAENLQSVAAWDGKQKLSALVAAFVNEIRLIDNIIISK